MMVARPKLLLALVMAALLAGCARKAHVPAPGPPPPAEELPSAEEPPIPIEWRAVATAPDHDRLGRVAAAWESGLRAARAARFVSALRQEGTLLDPTAALERPTPPPGRYRCRVVRLGGKPAFTAFPSYYCYVEAEGELLALTKETGTQRPTGRLWSDGERRLVFLGSEAGISQAPAPAYGLDEARDVVGVMERVGPFRWRMAMPWPRGQQTLDVIELVPFLDCPATC